MPWHPGAGAGCSDWDDLIILSGSAVVRDFRSYSIDGTYTKSLRRVGSARGRSEASDISHRGCSEASRQRSCLRKPGGSSRMALGRAGGHVQCRARGGGGIARARSRLASSGCQGKISNHLLYSKELHVDLTGQGRPGSGPEEKPPAPKRAPPSKYDNRTNRPPPCSPVLPRGFLGPSLRN